MTHVSHIRFIPSRKVYLTNFCDKSVSVIDTATNTVIATIAAGTNPSRKLPDVFGLTR